MSKFSNENQSFSTELNAEIVTANRQLKIRPAEVLVTLLGLVAGIVLFCFNLIDLWGLGIILFGALWNFFTESNRFIAIVFGFLMCVLYGFIAGGMSVFGHAFLHLMFYLPTQLIYYYENRSTDNSISHTKTLTKNGYIGTVVCGWLVAFGLGIVLFKVGDPFYIVDALSSALLIVSVFMQNGKYRAYYPVRIVACIGASLMWLFVAIKTGFTVNSSAMIVLFVMYTVMDAIEWVRWKHGEI